MVMRSSANNSIYDVCFAPSNDRDFYRPRPTSRNDEQSEESLQADFLAIAEFFAAYQRGITTRIEETTTRLVDVIGNELDRFVVRY